MKKYILIIFSMIFVLSSCTKNDETTEYYQLSTDFVKYCYFEPGSYWIYQLGALSTYDTIIVDSTITYTGVNGLDNQSQTQYTYDAIEEFVKRPNEQNIKKWEIAATLTTGDGNSDFNNDLLRLYFEDRYNIILYPKIETGTLYDFGENEGYYENLGQLEEHEVNGQIFSNVYHTKVYDSLHPEGVRIYEFYIAKNYGIIEYSWVSDNDTTQWSLVDWSLSQ